MSATEYITTSYKDNLIKIMTSVLMYLNHKNNLKGRKVHEMHQNQQATTALVTTAYYTYNYMVTAH